MKKQPRPTRTSLSIDQLAQVRGGAYEFYVVIEPTKQGKTTSTTIKP